MKMVYLEDDARVESEETSSEVERKQKPIQSLLFSYFLWWATRALSPGTI